MAKRIDHLSKVLYPKVHRSRQRAARIFLPKKTLKITYPEKKTARAPKNAPGLRGRTVHVHSKSLVPTLNYKAPSVEDYWAGEGRGNSKLERAIDGVARSLNIFFDAYQYYVPLTMLTSTIIDFAILYPKRIAVFADGWAHQNRPGTQEQDAVRRDELEAMGWSVVVITEQDFLTDPTGSVAKINIA